MAGEKYSIQLSLAHEGEFGFTAVLFLNLGKENAGLTANLYYYNESSGELEFICADKVDEDGTVSLTFTHASDYVIVVDGEAAQEGGEEISAAASAVGDESSPEERPDTELPDTGAVWKPW